jgi:hypothetical protein
MKKGDVGVRRWVADYPDADTFASGDLQSQEDFWGRMVGSPEIDELVERSHSGYDRSGPLFAGRPRRSGVCPDSIGDFGRGLCPTLVIETWPRLPTLAGGAPAVLVAIPKRPASMVFGFVVVTPDAVIEIELEL